MEFGDLINLLRKTRKNTKHPLKSNVELPPAVEVDTGQLEINQVKEFIRNEFYVYYVL